MIGVCTAVIGDVAGHLGCFIYLKDSVNAIAFVALGTSVPGQIIDIILSFFVPLVGFIEARTSYVGYQRPTIEIDKVTVYDNIFI